MEDDIWGQILGERKVYYSVWEYHTPRLSESYAPLWSRYSMGVSEAERYKRRISRIRNIVYTTDSV
jgi:hypothetical protein